MKTDKINLKTQMFRNSKKGFSILEMVVVMGIITVLFTMGAATLLTSRDDYRLDAITEEFLTSLRDAKNRSIAIAADTASPTPNNAKVWAVDIIGTNYHLRDHFVNPSCPTNLDTRYEKQNILTTSGVTFTINEVDAFGTETAYDRAVVSYAAPFGKGYITIPTTATGCGSTGTIWKESNSPTKEFEIRNNSATLIPHVISSIDNSDKYLKVTITYKNKSRTLRISSNGDAYIY